MASTFEKALTAFKELRRQFLDDTGETMMTTRNRHLIAKRLIPNDKYARRLAVCNAFINSDGDICTSTKFDLWNRIDAFFNKHDKRGGPKRPGTNKYYWLVYDIAKYYYPHKGQNLQDAYMRICDDDEITRPKKRSRMTIDISSDDDEDDDDFIVGDNEEISESEESEDTHEGDLSREGNLNREGNASDLNREGNLNFELTFETTQAEIDALIN